MPAKSRFHDLSTRKGAILYNRQQLEKDSFEEHLKEYVEVARRQFKQGFIISSTMFVAVDRLKREEKSYRTQERMDAFEAKRIAERKKHAHIKKAA